MKKLAMTKIYLLLLFLAGAMADEDVSTASDEELSTTSKDGKLFTTLTFNNPYQKPIPVVYESNARAKERVKLAAVHPNSSISPAEFIPGSGWGWSEYTGNVLGQSFNGPPGIFACGYFDPANMPNIRLGQNEVPPGFCDNLDTFNDPRYDARPKDLPYDKFWSPRKIVLWQVSNQPIDYLNCYTPAWVPNLSSGIPFNAYWYSNVGIGRYWATWLRKRGIPISRLFDADTCISVWFAKGLEITLKVTHIDPDLASTDIKVEPSMYNQYFQNPPTGVLWTFTKCWGNAILQPMYYQASQTPGNVLNAFNNPPYRNCWAWVVSEYNKQWQFNQANDKWWNKAVQVPQDQWGSWTNVLDHVPNIIPKNSKGKLIF